MFRISSCVPNTCFCGHASMALAHWHDHVMMMPLGTRWRARATPNGGIHPPCAVWKRQQTLQAASQVHSSEGAGRPFVMAYTTPLFKAVGPPATEELKMMLADDDSLRYG